MEPLGEEKGKLLSTIYYNCPDPAAGGCTAKPLTAGGGHGLVLDFFGLLGTAFEIPPQCGEGRYGTS